MDEAVTVAEQLTAPELPFEGVPEVGILNPELLEGVFSSALNLVELGGPVVAVLLGLSVVSLALILFKAAQFLYLRVGVRKRSEQAFQLWGQGQAQEAIQMLDGDRSAVAEVMALAMKLGQDAAVPKQVVDEETSRVAMERLYGLQRGFRALDAIVQLAPLLGLFGTVLGMIEAFQTLQNAGNAVDPSILAGGIWVALMTTAAGLAVAMPVSIILTWFESLLENERVAIETMTTKLISQQQILTFDPPTVQRIAVVEEQNRYAH